MDKQYNFDFGTMWRPATSAHHNGKAHKIRPTQFDSVAEGTTKRLERNLRKSKSTRCTVFDHIRNLPAAETAPAPDPRKEKLEHRRQQLEKWKAEKEKKKKEAAEQKKKPFLVGVAHDQLNYVPPPPHSKPSSSRVTRSQKRVPVLTETNQKQIKIKSFAPKDAPFRPPELKYVPSILKFAPPSKTKKKETITFEPVQPNTVRQTRSKINRPIVTEVKTKPKTQKATRSTAGKQIRSAYNRFDMKTNQLTSSSSSELETSKKPIKRVQTPAAKKSEPEVKPITPKKLALSSETSSDESQKVIPKRKSMRGSGISINDSLQSCSENSSKEEPEVHHSNNKSTQKISIHECSVVLVDSSLIKPKPDMMTTPKIKILKSESDAEQKLRSPKTPERSPLTPEQIDIFKSISPCVTLSRGKENARKEMKWKISTGMINFEAEEDDLEHFRQQLASTVARITAECDVWDKISEQNNLPESVLELVLSAVGQGRLLVSQKLRQFSSLVETAAGQQQPDATVITTTDLRGFWDMVYMQVENIYMRFKKLEELRDRNWVEEKPPIVQKPVHASPAKKTTKKSTATSRLKDVIAAARKANKKQQAQPGEPSVVMVEAPNEKTFEAGFFTVRSPVQSPVRTPSKQTLLKAVLSSEAKKTTSRNSASFAMLRASILGKCPEYEGIALLPQTPSAKPINLNATPARSILKSGNIPSSNTKANRSVLFIDNDSSEDSSETTSQEGLSDENTIYFSSSEDTRKNKKQDEIEENVSDNDVSSIQKVTRKYERNELVRQNAFSDQDKDIPSLKCDVNVSKTLDRHESVNKSSRKSLRKTRGKPSDIPKDNNTSSENENISKTSSRKRQDKAPEKSPLKTDEHINTPITTYSEEKNDNTYKISLRKRQNKALEKSPLKTDEHVNTPRRMSSRKRREDQAKAADISVASKSPESKTPAKKTPRRSSAKKALQEIEVNVMEVVPTPKRSVRGRKSAGTKQIVQ